MKAMVITDFGGPEVFKLQEVPTPTPGPNQVLVKVYATSVNPVDYKMRQTGARIGLKPPAILGYDVSGVVEAVGEGVTDFATGDEVYYTPEISPQWGSYAEYHLARQEIVARKPANLSHLETASLPLAGDTAWGALINRAKLTLAETVLIHGAGGVGSLAIQIARTAGANVFVTSGPAMLDLARELGARRVINYRAEDFVEIIKQETHGAGVDLVFDTVGNDTLARSLAVTRPFGRMVGIVNTEGDLNTAYRQNITIHFTFLQRLRANLDALRALIERHQLVPVIDSVLPLTEVAEAHRRLEQGRVKGKIVLDVAAL